MVQNVAYDLVVRNGRIIDGTGEAPYIGDVGIIDGIISAIGKDVGRGAEEIDAAGCIVTPGFVDIHTHYDGHATWGERLKPSSSHGVTTVVMGNCGVGFAPCRPADRVKLVNLMEGVEDIPEPVMATGLPWTWQSFPEYLDQLDQRSYDIDIGAQLPHAPLRVYVMGDRAIARSEATPKDIAKMAEIATEAMRAGALGFSTSRSLNHRAADGSVTPSYAAAKAELVGIANGVKAAGTGVLQIISDFDDPVAEFDIIEEMARSGRPLSLSLLQLPQAPSLWRDTLGRIEHANSTGMQIKAQVAARPVGLLLGLELSKNPFSLCPSYLEISHLPLDERLAAMREPSRRDRIIAEYPATVSDPNQGVARVLHGTDTMFILSDPPQYEPSREESVACLAERRSVSVAAFLYELIMADGGSKILYFPVMNYANYSIEAVETMLNHPDSLIGIGDGGAHCGLICDASMPTYTLIRWAGDGPGKIPLPKVVKMLTADLAGAVELHDRGLIAKGYKADLNIINLDELKIDTPHMAYELPGGGGQLYQGASGYAATIVNGIVTYRHGKSTGALPGRLVRGGCAQMTHST
jgi:N-acyl-D-aspartate/D-glutamate deacylase